MIFFRLTKKQNKISFPWEKFRNWMQTCRVGDYWIKAERIRSIRSNEQNSCWHGWVRIIADWSGELDPEETCKDVKVRLGYCRKEKNKFGDEKLICPSTALMNVSDMSELLMKTEALMAELTDGKMKLPRSDEFYPYE